MHYNLSDEITSTLAILKIRHTYRGSTLALQNQDLVVKSQTGAERQHPLEFLFVKKSSGTKIIRKY